MNNLTKTTLAVLFVGTLSYSGLTTIARADSVNRSSSYKIAQEVESVFINFRILTSK